MLPLTHSKNRCVLPNCQKTHSFLVTKTAPYLGKPFSVILDFVVLRRKNVFAGLQGRAEDRKRVFV